MKRRLHIKVVGHVITYAAIVLIFINLTWTGPSMAMHTNPHHSFLGGPWELVVKMGHGGDGLRFPLSVSDEIKPQKLDEVFPVLKSPIKIKLEQYIPDLTWETTAIPHPDGSIVVQLTAKGSNLQEHIWLSPGDPARQSVSSSVGSIAIRKLHNPDTAEALIRKLTNPKTVGILSIWTGDDNRPFECAARVRETTALPGSKYKIAVAEYVPHYTIDTETKKVSSRSDKPVNPAVKVILSDGNKTYERWLWSKFLSYPHEKEKLPVRMRFTDFHLDHAPGNHILAVADSTRAWMLSSEKGRTRLDKAGAGRSYSFADKAYSFRIEQILDEAIIKKQWKNNSERLLRPAVVATIQHDGTALETILELNKPFHLRTKSGVLVLLYRRRPASSEAAR